MVLYFNNATALQRVIGPNPHRLMQDYMVVYLMQGSGLLSIGLYLYPLSEGDIFFLSRYRYISLKTKEDTRGDICQLDLGHEFWNAHPLLDYLENHPHFHPNNVLIQCGDKNREVLENYLSKMLQEHYLNKQDSTCDLIFETFPVV